MKRTLSLTALAFALGGIPAASMADDGCFLFTNKSNAPVHVSLDSRDFIACPRGYCWDGDVRPNETRDYCPGPLVMSDRFMNYTLVFMRGDPKHPPYTVDQLTGTLRSSNRVFRCSVMITPVGLEWSVPDCAAVELHRP